MDSRVSEMLSRYSIEPAVLDFLRRPSSLFIDGAFVPAHGTAIPVFEPSTGGYLAAVANAGSADVDTAVAAARRAFESSNWRTMKPLDRQRLLADIADLLEKEATIVAQLETIDSGKAITGCMAADILGSVDLLRFMSGLVAHAEGTTKQLSAASGEFFAYTRKEPAGVIGCIVPWNFPLNTTVWKIAAPLAAGCTVVVKPDHNTSLSTLYFADLCCRAGLQNGVFNVVTGAGADVGAMLVSHPGIDRITFTGSTQTGRAVGAAAGAALKHSTLELGGKSPMIVCADANLAAVAEATRSSVFFNAGQVCSAGSRIYVERSVSDALVTAIVAVIKGLKVGPGLDVATDLGPVATLAHQHRIQGFVARAVKAGAMIFEGGSVPAGQGYYVRPAVLLPARPDDECVREEIFGPILSIVRCDSVDEAVRFANDSPYALAASVWTRDISRAIGLVNRIEAGTVWVNTHDLSDPAMPFGGFKSSGFGKDLGREQFDECFRIKAVTIAL